MIKIKDTEKLRKLLLGIILALLTCLMLSIIYISSIDTDFGIKFETNEDYSIPANIGTLNSKLVDVDAYAISISSTGEGTDNMIYNYNIWGLKSDGTQIAIMSLTEEEEFTWIGILEGEYYNKKIYYIVEEQNAELSDYFLYSIDLTKTDGKYVTQKIGIMFQNEEIGLRPHPLIVNGILYIKLLDNYYVYDFTKNKLINSSKVTSSEELLDNNFELYNEHLVTDPKFELTNSDVIYYNTANETYSGFLLLPLPGDKIYMHMTYNECLSANDEECYHATYFLYNINTQEMTQWPYDEHYEMVEWVE